MNEVVSVKIDVVVDVAHLRKINEARARVGLQSRSALDVVENAISDTLAFHQTVRDHRMQIDLPVVEDLRRPALLVA